VRSYAACDWNLDLSERTEELTQRTEELTQRTGELTQRTEELTQRTEEPTALNARLEGEITQRKVAENQLHQAQKMEALGQLNRRHRARLQQLAHSGYR